MEDFVNKEELPGGAVMCFYSWKNEYSISLRIEWLENNKTREDVCTELPPEIADRLIAWLIEARGHRLVDASVFEHERKRTELLIKQLKSPFYSAVVSSTSPSLSEIDTDFQIKATLTRLRGENE